MRADHPRPHRRLLVRRVLLALALTVLPACASGDDDTATPDSSSSSTAASSDTASGTPAGTETEKVVEVRVSVTDGKVEPAPRRVEVEKDSQVRLLVTSDVDDELHVHGYEIEAELEAGRPTTVELSAEQTGLFGVETHESELELLQLEVR